MPLPENPSTSLSLLEQVKNNEPSGWERLAAIYGPIVYHWSRLAGLQPADSANVLQEVFRAVYLNIQRFQLRQPEASFRSWLRTVHHSKLMDHYRQRRTDQEFDSRFADVACAELDSSAQLRAEHSEIVQRAMQAIKKDFSDRTWEAFWRSSISGDRTRDVARELNMSSAAVCMCRARVLRRLREFLEDFADFSRPRPFE